MVQGSWLRSLDLVVVPHLGAGRGHEEGLEGRQQPHGGPRAHEREVPHLLESRDVLPDGVGVAAGEEGEQGDVGGALLLALGGGDALLHLLEDLLAGESVGLKDRRHHAHAEGRGLLLGLGRREEAAPLRAVDEGEGELHEPVDDELQPKGAVVHRSHERLLHLLRAARELQREGRSPCGRLKPLAVAVRLEHHALEELEGRGLEARDLGHREGEGRGEGGEVALGL
mmetsp:Transcript_7486/g.25516  ORF Transcript_7486/g.25516 Transcript_7486/m.25516 type:complete len:227 (-) Transcript_7486:94-774(-)